MSQQNNQWQIVHQHQRACGLAEKFGFKIKQDEFNKVRIVAEINIHMHIILLFICVTDLIMHYLFLMAMRSIF